MWGGGVPNHLLPESRVQELLNTFLVITKTPERTDTWNSNLRLEIFNQTANTIVWKQLRYWISFDKKLIELGGVRTRNGANFSQITLRGPSDVSIFVFQGKFWTVFFCLKGWLFGGFKRFEIRCAVYMVPETLDKNENWNVGSRQNRPRHTCGYSNSTCCNFRDMHLKVLSSKFNSFIFSEGFRGIWFRFPCLPIPNVPSIEPVFRFWGIHHPNNGWQNNAISCEILTVDWILKE